MKKYGNIQHNDTSLSVEDEVELVTSYRLVSAGLKAEGFAYMARMVNAEADTYGRTGPENDDYLCFACLSAEPHWHVPGDRG